MRVLWAICLPRWDDSRCHLADAQRPQMRTPPCMTLMSSSAIIAADWQNVIG
jgi:hypothetical protein